jgi:O-antigen biosynthesis protein
VKIAIYNQYFATLGGGERRSAFLAAHLCKEHEVTLFVRTPIEKDLIKNIFGIDLSNVTIVALENKEHSAEIARVCPDIFINNSYGSELPCISPIGIYMCMFPANDQIDLSSYNVVTANSNYTAKWILNKWGYKAEVVYSACQFIGPCFEKENVILNVARFFEDTPIAHHKRQDVLVKAFRSLIDQYGKGWELHLAGNIGDQSFVEYLKLISDQYPVRILTNLDYDQLRQEYRRAAIYWHATGFGYSEDDHPSKQEHFGMSIIEAMSAGAVPLAFDGGGPRESIRPNVNGFLWNSVDDLIHHTQRLISDRSLMQSMSSNAVEDSKQFEANEFLRRMDAIIDKLIFDGHVRSA